MPDVSRLIPGTPFIIAGVLYYFDVAGLIAGRTSSEPERSRLRLTIQLVMYLGVIIAGRFLLDGVDGVIDPFTIGISGTMAFLIAHEQSTQRMARASEQGTWTKERETRISLVLLAAYVVFGAVLVVAFWNG